MKRKWFNKYVLTVLLFLVWLLFFDKYNFFAQQKLKASTVKLENDYTKLLRNIEIAKEEKKDLLSDQEKYGREKYYLHKNDEDVFIIENKQE
mgnify:CR=1 FL=1